MRILVVEDHTTFGPELKLALEGLAGAKQVDLAVNRAAGIALAGSAFWDLVILDLAIPASDTEPGPEVEHGQALFHDLQAVCPGLPIFVLTGSAMTTWGQRLSRFGQNVDLWGSGAPSNTVDYISKEDVETLLSEVERIAAEVTAVNGIRLNFRGRDLDLGAGAERAIRVATRRAGGVAADVVTLGGGLSRARVVRIRMSDERGGRLATVVAKLGTRADISKEIAAYDLHVKRLPLGTFPHKFEVIELGLCGAAAIFYQLAEEYDRTLFDVLSGDATGALAVVPRLRGTLSIWIDAGATRRVPISELREHVVWPAEFERIVADYSLNVSDIEDTMVDCRIGCIHGDLHGGNILVGAIPAHVVIDFGDVGDGPLCLDPLSLEMSVVFHPDGLSKGIVADVPKYLSSWTNFDGLPDTEQGRFLRECREWAFDVGVGDLAVLAVAYGYAVRQLRFDTVDAMQTLALIDHICESIRKIR